MAKKSTIGPEETTTRFWFYASKLRELIFWAREPDPTTTMRDGWRDWFHSGVQELSSLAHDAAPDEVTRSRIVRSQSLALQLVRMLHEWPEVNGTSCRNWSQVDQHIVNELADLQSKLARIGDGERPEPPATGAQPTNGAAREHSPWIG